MNKPILSKGIYKKLAIISLVIAFFIGLIISFLQIHSDYQNQEAEFTKEISSLVTVLKPSAEKAIFEFDEDLAQLVTNSFFDHPSVLRISIYDDHGDVFIQQALRKAANRPSWFIQTKKLEIRDLTFKLDVNSELDNPQARLEVMLDPYLALKVFFNRSWLTILFEIVKVILLTITFLFVCYRLVTSPIKKVADALTDLDPFSDSFKMPEIPTNHLNDEIGFLSLKVNNLMRRLKSGISDIKDLNLQLNKEISERSQIEQLLNYVEENTAGITGYEYVELMAGFISKSLSLDGIVISDFNQEQLEIKGYFPDIKKSEDLSDAFDIDFIKNELSTNDILVINQQTASFSNKKYSCIFLPLKSHSGNLIGFLGLLSRHSFSDDFYKQHKALLKIYSSRIATEIERDKQVSFINNLARKDSLTQLANRYGFNQVIKEMIDFAVSSNNKLALLYIDLDRFKFVNDSFGHRVGDMLLQKVAARLEGIISEEHFLARIGGDEFAVLLPFNSENLPQLIAEQIQHEFEKPFTVEKRIITTNSSIGIAIYPDTAQNAESLLKNSDIAMYVAKKSSMPRIEYFSEAFDVQAKRKVQVETALNVAILSESIHLVYQPQFRISDNALVGMEALVRWEDPELGIISPDEFIPIAEETGLIHKLGEWVFKEVSKQTKIWQDTYGIEFRTSINVSGYQLKSPLIFDNLLTHFTAEDINPQSLIIEITETALIENIDYTATLLDRLTQLGFKISIDDFGTGYSSLRYLRSLPIDYLKIDKAFISGLPNSANDTHIVQAVIALANAMNLEVVAEGVETTSQAELLHQFNCQYAQGYHYSYPQRPENLNPILSQINQSSK